MAVVVPSRIHKRHPATDTTHGTQRAYKNGCHCPACTEAARRASNAYKLTLLRSGRRQIDATGTRRRVLALGMIGWPHHAIALKAGVTTRQVQRIANGTSDVVHVLTAAAIRDAYDALSMTPAPAGTNRAEKVGRALVVRAARVKGGAVPLAWDDEALDDPNATPATLEPGQRTRDDVVEDVEFILGHDPLATSVDIASRLGYGDQTGVQNALRRAGRTDLLAKLARNAEVAA